MRYATENRLMGIGMIIVGLLAVPITGYFTFVNAQIVVQGVATTGTVVSPVHCSEVACTASVEWETSSGQVVTDTIDVSGGESQGDPISVRYLSSNPTIATAEGLMGRLFKGFATFGILIFSIGLLTAGVLRLVDPLEPKNFTERLGHFIGSRRASRNRQVP